MPFCLPLKNSSLSTLCSRILPTCRIPASLSQGVPSEPELGSPHRRHQTKYFCVKLGQA